MAKRIFDICCSLLGLLLLSPLFLLLDARRLSVEVRKVQEALDQPMRAPGGDDAGLLEGSS